MSTSSFTEKDDVSGFPSSSTSTYPPPRSSYFPRLGPLSTAYNRFQEWRASLSLPNPGTVENLQKEVKSAYNLCQNFSLVLSRIQRRYSSHKLFLRRCTSRHHQGTVHEPSVPDNPFVYPRITDIVPFLQLWDYLRDPKCVLRRYRTCIELTLLIL